MYKKGGKKPKSSFMEKSKEIKFGDGGLYSKAEQSENIAKVKKMNSMQGPEHQTQVKKQTGGGKQIATPTGPATPDVPTGRTGYMVPVIKENQGMGYKKNGNKNTLADKLKKPPISVQGTGYKKEGNSNTLAKELQKKKTGGKSMEPGGGGRFAALVGKLKSKGKSTESAKAIAASIGRKKYGKSKFQEMAAKGKKGLGGMSDSTGSNEAGMGMMEGMKKKRSEKVGARSEKVMNKAKANWQKAEAVVKFDKSEEYQNMAGDRFGRIATDKANQLYSKAERQQNRAKKLKEKSEFLKASGKRMGGKKC